MVRVTVCKKCGWKDKRIRRALESLVARHGKDVDLLKRDCLDACDDEPAVRVGKRLLAPAKVKDLERRVAKRLAKKR